jgi:hypothetical protein
MGAAFLLKDWDEIAMVIRLREGLESNKRSNGSGDDLESSTLLESPTGEGGDQLTSTYGSTNGKR